MRLETEEPPEEMKNDFKRRAVAALFCLAGFAIACWAMVEIVTITIDCKVTP